MRLVSKIFRIFNIENMSLDTTSVVKTFSSVRNIKREILVE